MSTPLMAASVTVQESETWGGLNHWVVGAGTLLLLVIALGILVAFGGGREHS
jgi:hypothetical protein